MPDTRSPSQRLEVFGEVVGGDEGHDMGFEAFQVVIVIDLDGGVLPEIRPSTPTAILWSLCR